MPRGRKSNKTVPDPPPQDSPPPEAERRPNESVEPADLDTYQLEEDVIAAGLVDSTEPEQSEEERVTDESDGGDEDEEDVIEGECEEEDGDVLFSESEEETIDSSLIILSVMLPADFEQVGTVTFTIAANGIMPTIEQIPIEDVPDKWLKQVEAYRLKIPSLVEQDKQTFKKQQEEKAKFLKREKQKTATPSSTRPSSTDKPANTTQAGSNGKNDTPAPNTLPAKPTKPTKPQVKQRSLI